MSPQTSPGSGNDLKLRRFEWTGLIEDKFLNSTLTGALGAGIGSVVLVTGDPPSWMTDWHLFASVPLTAACLVLAYLRVWKTIHEEAESNAIWADIAENDPAPEGRDGVGERVMELPYILSLMALPLSAILPQVFLLVLLVFYWSDNYYNATLVRGVAARLRGEGPSDAGEPGTSPADALPGSLPRAIVTGVGWLLEAFTRPLRPPAASDRALGDKDPERLVAYFVVRFGLDLFLLVATLFVVALTLVAPKVLATPILDPGGAAQVIAVYVVIVFLIEWLLEPLRNLGHTFHGTDDPGGVVSVRDVRQRASLDPEVQAQLDAIHREAFGSEERQYSMGYMLDMAGRPGSLFRIILEGGRAIGYVYLGLAPAAGAAFLWYMAIHRDHRSRGAGSLATRDTLDLLRRDHPGLRYALFEVHRSDGHGDAAIERTDRRRVEFYRRLGAHWVRGVDYRIPAAEDRAATVAYDPMFFALRGPYLESEVRAGILAMARDNFDDHPDDQRWLDLQASLDRMEIVGPRVLAAG